MAENLEKKAPNVRFKGFTYDWEQQKLENLVTVNSGRDYKHLSEGNIPVYGTGGYMLSVNEKLSDTDAIGIGRKGTIDKPYILKAPFWTVDTLFYAVPEDNVDLNFMYSIFKKINWKKLDESTGVPSLAKTTINKLKVFIPKEKEQEKIGRLFKYIDTRIFLYQRKIGLLQQLKKAMLQRLFPDTDTYPKLRFGGFSGPWEQRKLGDEFERVNERNNGQFKKNRWISVANMYFQNPDKVQTNNIDTRTYVMRYGDIAFEGHPNKEFKFGRFVANDIGDGVVSELFPIYRHIALYDNNYWKYAIHLESIMSPIFAKSLTSSGNSSNKLETKHFLKQKIYVPTIVEQKQIGNFFVKLDTLIALQQRNLDNMHKLKKFMLQNLFI